MSDRVDKILDAIDAGLQTPGDDAYGEGDNVFRAGLPPWCISCYADLDNPAAGDICPKCRARLNDEAPPHGIPRPIIIGVSGESFGEAMQRLGEALVLIVQPVLAFMEEHADAVNAILADLEAMAITDTEADRLLEALDEVEP